MHSSPSSVSPRRPVSAELSIKRSTEKRHMTMIKRKIKMPAQHGMKSRTVLTEYDAKLVDSIRDPDDTRSDH